MVPGEAEKTTFRRSTVTSRALHHARFHYSFKIVLLTTVPTVSRVGYWFLASRTFVQRRIHGASRRKLTSRRSAAFVHRGSTRCALTASSFGPLGRCSLWPSRVVQIARRLVRAVMQFAGSRRTGKDSRWLRRFRRFRKDTHISGAPSPSASATGSQSATKRSGRPRCFFPALRQRRCTAPAQFYLLFPFRLRRRLGIDGLKNVFPFWTSRIAEHTVSAQVSFSR
jgi:hypothetical protein